MRKLLLLIMMCPLLLNAQDRKAAKSEELREAREMAEVVQMGGIVVRLATNARKIEGMQEVLDNGQLSAPNKHRLEERLQATITETREQQELIVRLMRENYDLGPVYFIYDSTLVLLQGEKRSGYFLNDNLEIDPNIMRPEDFIVARMGYTDASTTARAEAMMLSDRELQPLPNPFPNAITFNNLGYAFNKLLAPDIAERRRLEGMIQRLRNKLNSAVEDVLDGIDN